MIALLILAIWHPGRFLVGPGSEIPKPSRSEKKQAKLDRKAAKHQRSRKSSKESSIPGHVTDEYEVAEYPTQERHYGA
jgi:hypothetical protein